MKQSVLSALGTKIEDPAVARKIIKITFGICLLYAALRLGLHFLSYSPIHAQLGYYNIFISLGMSITSIILGFFILKEKLWAAYLVCFLLVCVFIFRWLELSKGPGIFGIVQFIFFTSSARAISYLDMHRT